MNLQELRNSNRIIFECVSGSNAYGTNTPQSDIDLRGFFINPAEEYLALDEPSEEISDEKNDVTFYGLKKAFKLLEKSNPNMIELLYMPEECIIQIQPAMKALMAFRHYFISKQCYISHAAYAKAQIGKAKGQNKMVHNPQPEERPSKEQFCWVINDIKGYQHHLDDACTFPARPVPLSDTGIDLSNFHVAALEHSPYTYRLYHYGNEAKGVFRGDDMLVCESIPKDDEFTKFRGLLIYNQEAYEKAVREWKKYWDWREHRNEARWLDQEKGKLTYDSKNMMHCMRLLMSAESILEKGMPIVRFSGEKLDYLRKIRSSELEYEAIMADVEARMTRLEEDFQKSDLPKKPDRKRLSALYKEVYKCHQRNT